MSKIGTAYAEATNNDMGLLVEAANDVSLGWAINDLENATARLAAFTGDLSAVNDEIDIIVARITKIAERAGN